MKVLRIFSFYTWWLLFGLTASIALVFLLPLEHFPLAQKPSIHWVHDAACTMIGVAFGLFFRKNHYKLWGWIAFFFGTSAYGSITALKPALVSGTQAEIYYQIGWIILGIGFCLKAFRSRKAVRPATLDSLYDPEVRLAMDSDGRVWQYRELV